MPTKEELLTAKKAYLISKYDSYYNLQRFLEEEEGDYEQLLNDIPEMDEDEINRLYNIVEEYTGDEAIWDWYLEKTAEPEKEEPEKEEPEKEEKIEDDDVISQDANPIHINVVRGTYARELGVSLEEAYQMNLPQLLEWYNEWFKEQTEEAQKEIAETEENLRLQEEAEKLKKESEYTPEEMTYFSRAFNWYVYDKYGKSSFSDDPHLNIVQIQDFLDKQNDYRGLKETVQMYDQVVEDAKKAYIQFGLENDEFNLKLPDFISEEDFDAMENEDARANILLESLEKELAELNESSIVKWYVDYTKRQQLQEKEKAEKEYEELLAEYPENFEDIPDEDVKTDDTAVQTVLGEIQKAKEQEEIKQQEERKLQEEKPVVMQENQTADEKLPDEKIDDDIIGDKAPEEEMPEEEIPEIIELEEDDEPQQEINNPIPPQQKEEPEQNVEQEEKKEEVAVKVEEKKKDEKHNEKTRTNVEKMQGGVFRDFIIPEKPKAVKIPQKKVEEPKFDIRKYGVLLNKLSQDLNSTQGFFSRDSQEFKDLLGYMNAIGDFTALDQRQMNEALNSIDVLAGAYIEHTLSKPIDNSRRHNREGIADKLIGVVKDFRSKGTQKYTDSIIARARCFTALEMEIKKGPAADGTQIAKAYAKLMVMNALDSRSHSKRKLAEYDSQVVELWTKKFLKTDSFRNMLRDVKGIKAMMEDYKKNPGLLRTASEIKMSEKLLNDMGKEKDILDKLADISKEKAKEPVAKGPGMNL